MFLKKKMNNFLLLPKDILRLLLINYIYPLDYPNLLFCSTIFHILQPKEKSLLYKRVLQKREQEKTFYGQIQKRFKCSKDMTKELIKVTFTLCDRCGTCYKKRNEARHSKKCPRRPNRKQCTECHKVYNVDERNGCVFCNSINSLVRCTSPHCEFKGLRYEMWKHVKPCLEERLLCVGCGDYSTRADMISEDHFKFPCWGHVGYACPYGCGLIRAKVLTRVEWEKHKEACGNIEYTCAGCKRKVKRKYLNLHKEIGNNYYNSARFACQSETNWGRWLNYPTEAYGISETQGTTIFVDNDEKGFFFSAMKDTDGSFLQKVYLADVVSLITIETVRDFWIFWMAKDPFDQKIKGKTISGTKSPNEHNVVSDFRISLLGAKFDEKKLFHANSLNEATTILHFKLDLSREMTLSIINYLKRNKCT